MFASQLPRYLILGLLVATGCGNTVTPTNCADNPVGCLCVDDSSCGAPNPRCNRADGRCVPCLPAGDNCAQGTHCVNDNGYKCVPTSTCVVSGDCPRKTIGAVPVCCGGMCFDDSTKDPDNCGGCGLKCATPPNATAACAASTCVIAGCKMGFANCDNNSANGCETSTGSDIRNCGACGKTCAAGGNGTPTCTNGVCGASCVDGFSDCDNNPQNGCEVSTATDTRNCGACGSPCGVLPGSASVLCIKGMCTAGSCSGWFGDCDGNPANGCESDTQADPANCGGCKKACPSIPNGTSGCAVGACGIAKCNAGFADCNNDPKDGCETKIGSDVNNCGVCNKICSGNNSQQSCVNGMCAVAACNQGFNDCDMKAANGCEVNTLSDVLHCNGCGMVCPVPSNTIPLCKLGVCGVGGCKPGFADCNMDPADGCEVDITSTSNCGGCGVVCAVPPNATAACRNGVCGIGMCNMGFADCDQNNGTGCEVNVNADNKNCGVCGIACVPPMGGNIGNQCTNAKCVVGGCIPGWSDCDNDKLSCESDVNGDAKNCGACGVVCPMNLPYCVNAKCGLSTHNIKKFVFDFSGGAGGCGDFSIWYTINLGIMDYNACEVQANNYGAQFMGQGPNGQIYNYAAPYVGFNRWVGEATETNAFIGTASWNQVSSVSKVSANIYCILGYANANTPGQGTFAKSTQGLNGKIYKYEDYGVISEKTCYTNALAAGARPLNPWMMTGVTLGTAHMSENHSCHGSTQYCNAKGSYCSDGGGNHNYRCLVGYND